MTEGKVTEPTYIEGLNRFFRDSNVETVVKAAGVGKSPLRLVEECIAKRKRDQHDRKEFDEYICLTDVDDHTDLTQALALAKRESILLLVSNPKFEVWLRWHAEDSRSALSSRQLNERVKQLNLLEGKRIASSFRYERVHQACEIARKADPDLASWRVGPNPSSALPVLIDLATGKRIGSS